MKKHGGKATSFGLKTRGGDKADPRTIMFGSRHGYDLTSHITLSVTSFTIQPHDLLIGMEPSHTEQLHQLFPTHQITALGLWLPQKNIYLHDPYSANNTYFDKCAKNIVTATLNLLNKFKQNNKEKFKMASPPDTTL